MSRRTARDWAIDALCFLLGLGFTVLAWVDATERQLPPGPTAVEAALGGVASLGVWLRRRWPVGLAVVTGLFGLYSVSASGIALIALFTVAVHRRSRTAVRVAAGLAVMSLLTPVVRTDWSPATWWQSLLGVACVVAVMALGMFVRTRRQLARAEQDRAAAEQERRLAQVRQLERARIGREMHDVLAHRLSLLSLQAGALEVWPEAPAEVAHAAGAIRTSAHGALEELREVIGVLRSDQVEDDPPEGPPQRPQPTLADLPLLVDEAREAGTPVVLECAVDDLRAVPAATARTAYRIVQEGLTNARKHADHAPVTLLVRGGATDGLTVEIRNPAPVPGPSTALIPGASLGLVGLAERTTLVGGRLQHGRTPAGEFRLSAWLPWPA